MANLIRMTMLVLPWISVVFLPKKSLKEYMPVSLLGSFLVAGMCVLAAPFKWWTVSGGWKFKLFNDSSFIFGPFLVGTLWIYHFTFGNFKRYLLANLIMDSFFSYPLTYLFQRVKMFRLVRFTPTHIFMSFTIFSFIMYGFKLIFKQKNNIQ